MQWQALLQTNCVCTGQAVLWESRSFNPETRAKATQSPYLSIFSRGCRKIRVRPPPKPAVFSMVAGKKLPPQFNYQLLSLIPMHNLLINTEKFNTASQKLSIPRCSCINSMGFPGLSDLVPSIISQMKFKYSALPQNKTGPLAKGLNVTGAAQTSIFSGKQKAYFILQSRKQI